MEIAIPTLIPKERAEYFERWLANAQEFSRRIELRLGSQIDVDTLLAADREELEQRCLYAKENHLFTLHKEK
jgi:hypothetical protein